MAQATSLWADVFSNGKGLGRSVRTTYEALTDHPQTTAQVLAARPVVSTPRAVQEHLRKLSDHGMAIQDGKTWRRVIPSLEHLHALAARLGVAGTTHHRRAQHEDERTAWKADRIEFKKSHAPWNSSLGAPTPEEEA